MRTVVVIPTYNERATITAILDAVLRETADADVLVVDDDSPDGTGALVRGHRELGRRVHLLSRVSKDGLGAAYRAGFAWALEHDYEAIVQMDADFSHPPDRIPALVSALDDADVVVGSRYVRGGATRDWPITRRAISRGGNLYVRWVLGLPVRDATAGFKAFRRDALVRIGAAESASSGYCFQIENTWHAVASGLRVTEVPITFTDRTLGESKMSAAIVVEALARVLAWRWSELWQRAPRPSDELLTFLAVGAAGYVVDVGVFNLLRSAPLFSTADPSIARVLAVAAAMVVTYGGNRRFTWRGAGEAERRLQIALFVVFNVVGLGFSVVSLTLSHDVLGLTSRLADNISANVVGLAMGTAFRFWSYRRFVFAADPGGHDPVIRPSYGRGHGRTPEHAARPAGSVGLRDRRTARLRGGGPVLRLRPSRRDRGPARRGVGLPRDLVAARAPVRRGRGSGGR
ncbi:glycosyltransferase [Aeromicrobium terrae]|uniref:glycosyltransferase n=1 Tax=Aeromicrobium terrae TaxID=2498846 RepID=UPI00164F6277|nr:glycosyltransferase family 2 protein [Aeromicrobium terrae]